MGKSRDYENSKKDKMADRKEARKRKMSLREWEGSPEDEVMDSAGMKKMAGGGMVSRGKGVAQRGFDYSFR